MKISKSTLNDLKQQGKSDSDIGIMFGLSARTIWEYRKGYGIKPKDPLFIPSEILEKLSRTNSDEDIAKMFKVHRRTIGFHRKKYNIPSTCPLKGNRLYPIDHNFFNIIDSEEKAYALGFIASDGYIDTKGKVLSIAIQQRDKYILERIRTMLGSTAPILLKKSSQLGKGDLQVIYLCSKIMVKDLSTFGITPAKSKYVSYPKIEPIFDRHYIRGIIDGDGNINSRNFSITSNSKMLDGINEAIFKHTGHKLSSTPCNGYPRLIGYKRNKKVLNWIYENSSIHLTRKYNTFCQHWKTSRALVSFHRHIQMDLGCVR